MYNTTPLELSSSFIVDIDNIAAIEGRGVSLEHKMNIPARYNSKFRNALHRSTLFLSPRQGAGLPENFSVVHVRRVGILNLNWIGWEINLNRNCYVFSTRIHVVIVIVFRGKEKFENLNGDLPRGGERCWSSVWIKVQLIKTATFCCPVNAVTTLLTVVKSPGENSNTISSNVIEMSWPPSVEAGVKYLNDNEQGFKTWKKQFPFKNRLYGWMLKKKLSASL